MGNATYDNIFRNTDLINGNTNIKIIGLGSVKLNGNCRNNDDDYATYGPIDNNIPGNPLVYQYNTIFFFKVTNYEISGLYIFEYEHWCILMQKTNNGKIHDIFLTYNWYQTVNQDGIGLRFDSYDIEIYNIIAITDDDCFSAFTSHNMNLLGVTDVAGWNTGSIHDIYYHDINIIHSAYGSLFAFWAGDGERVYNIRYENALLRRGGSILYGSYAVPLNVALVPPVKTDIHDFNFKHIRFIESNGVSRNASFYFGQDMMDFEATGIINDTGKPMNAITDGADVTDNVKVNEVQVI
jgi:hypothetical protein